MAVERKVVRVVVKELTSTFEDDLQAALDAAIGVGQDWSIVFMDQVDHRRTKASYIIVLERTV